MRRYRIVFLLSACLAIVGPAVAQRVTTAVGGIVASDTGAGLAGVTVTVRNRATGFLRTATTGADGRYLIVGLPVEWEYQIRAELSGFAAVVRENVELSPEKALAIDFTLSVAAAEAIVVSAAEPSVQRELLTVPQTINENLVRSLPLFGRDFLHLASLAAGFTGNPDFPSPQGQLYWTNNVVVDGASHFSKWRSAARAFHSGYGLESIREVQVLTNQFSAEFGEALATVTSVVTEAGTNQLRGSGLFLVQDDALNAVPVFATYKPPSSAQQYGFTLSGPFVKDRTHFWGSYEGRRSRDHNIVVSPAALNAVVPDNQDEHLAFFRIDHQSSSRQLVTARYNGQRFRWHDETGGLALPGTGTSYATDVNTMLVTDTFQLSSRMLNEVRVQFARYVDIRQDLQPTVFVSRAGYSLEGGTLGPFGFGADPEDTWEAADAVSWWKGPHAIKVGGGTKYVRAHNMFLDNGRGAYFFAGPPNLYPQPFLFIQGLAQTEDAALVDPRSISAFGFFQDDWTIRSGLTLNLGLRYDVEDVSNVRDYAVPVDKNNFQPRVGVAWDPNGSGRMVIRGGVGLYTQQHLLYPINRIALEGPDGTKSVSVAPDSPLMPTFPATLSASAVILPPRDIQRVDATFTNPYSVQAAIGLERTFFGTQWAADYLYLVGHDLMSLVDVNAPESNIKPAQRTVAEADATRPEYPLPNTFRKVITLGNLGRSWYHALQLKAERSAGRLQLVASYTLSRAEDMANYLLPEDSRNIPAEKARASTDITHNLTMGFTWQLSEAGGGLLNDWSLSGVGIFRSGRPYDITWGDDRNGTTQNDARPDGRNTGTTDAFGNLDLALVKRFHLRGSAAVEARVEIFNVVNTTNYDVYVGQLLSPLFGQPVSAFPQRRTQLAAIVRF